MRKTLTAAMAALTLGGVMTAAAAPAQARDWDRHGGYGHWDGGHDYKRDNAGPAIAAGVVGLALGAALASNSHSYAYDRPYYRDAPYYRGAYVYDDGYYAPPYRMCESTRWVWDPYIHRQVAVTSRYAC